MNRKRLKILRTWSPIGVWTNEEVLDLGTFLISEKSNIRRQLVMLDDMFVLYEASYDPTPLQLAAAVKKRMKK